MSLTEEEIRQIREKLWAGYVITREQIVDGIIPLEHLEGTPGWIYDPHTGNWYNDARCAELTLQKAADNMLKVPMLEKPEIGGENILFNISDFLTDQTVVHYSLDMGLVEGTLIEIYDEGGRLTDVVRRYADQKAYWAGRQFTWEPPIPDRESGLICQNCGLDRGTQELCESCHEPSSALVVVDGKIVK